MIDLCKIFGVEEGEEFKFADDGLKHCIYKIEDNVLRVRNPTFKSNRGYLNSTIHLNTAVTIEVVKLPKKKEFTDDELAIMRSLPKEFKWMARDNSKNELCIYRVKPEKDCECWDSEMACMYLDMFNHIFQSIQWEDEEAVFIDDYVERGAE